MWWQKLLILEVTRPCTGSLGRCGVFLIFQKYNFFLKETILSLWIGRCILLKHWVLFLEDIKPCHLSPAQSKRPVQCGRSVLNWHSTVLWRPTLSFLELVSIIQWTSDAIANEQTLHPKHWETLICTFIQGARLPHSFHRTLLPSFVPFSLILFQDPNLSFSLTLHLPFPGSLSVTFQSVPVTMY